MGGIFSFASFCRRERGVDAKSFHEKVNRQHASMHGRQT
jgi:hypothetical protein